MKLNIQKLAVILVTFSLAVGLLSQTSTSLASSELRLPDCIGIIANCDNQDCSAEASNENNNHNSISQSTQTDLSRSTQTDYSQTSQDNSGAASGINTISPIDTLTASISSSVTMSDDDQTTQTSSASTSCNYNNDD